MADQFFTVTKGNKSRRVSEEQLPEFLSADWELVGTKRVTTETGERTLDAGEALDRISRGDAEGFVSEDVIRERRGDEFLEERFGDSGLQTFGESGLSALTFGLADPLLEGIANISEGDPGSVAARQRTNRGAALAGSLTGTLAGALLPGKIPFLPTTLAARGATRAGQAVGRATGSKAANLITQGTLDGTFFGAGQAYANATINDQPVTAEQIIASMGSEALFGAATGGILAGAVTGLGKLSNRLNTGKALTQKFSDDLADTVRKATTQVEAEAGLFAAQHAGNIRVTTAADNVSSALKSGKALDMDPVAFNGFLDDLGSITSPATHPDLDEFAKLVKKHPHKGLLTGKLVDPSGELTGTARFLEEAGIKNVKALNPTQEFLARTYAAKATAVADTATKGGILGAALGVGGGRAGGVVKAMQGAVKSTTDKIKSSVKGFIKQAGTHRRGTVPAATAILGKIRFDADVGEKPKSSPQKLSKRTTEFKQRAAEIERLASNPELVKQRVHNSLKEMKVLKPGLANQLSRKALERFQFINRILPRDPNNNNAFGPGRWVPSRTEIDKFSRIAAAAENPLSLLDDLENGRVTQEAVDTVRQLYPEIYHDIQMEIVNSIDEIKENVGYQGRIQLGLLFQVPTDVVLQPDFINKMQQNYAEREQEREQPGQEFSTPGSMQSSLNNQQTASQRVEAK